IAPLKRFSPSGERNFQTDDKDGIIEKLERVYADADVDHLDGIRVELLEVICLEQNLEQTLEADLKELPVKDRKLTLEDLEELKELKAKERLKEEEGLSVKQLVELAELEDTCGGELIICGRSIICLDCGMKHRDILHGEAGG
ncbi:MAG: hypothetical protein IH827_07005, partial [Myxococcales bacterium]|nr:hypothetical protein [Myxococcales bacterium]